MLKNMSRPERTSLFKFMEAMLSRLQALSDYKVQECHPT